MKLPSTVIISSDKIRLYLLSPRKRNDKSKWLANAGYKLENWKQFERDIRLQILTLEASMTEETKYGKMYEIKGKLTGPNGKTLHIRSIWMNEKETKLFKFITIFPNKK